MRILWLLFACLSLLVPAWAQPPLTDLPETGIDYLEWSQVRVRDGDRITGRVVLRGPAPPGGLTIIFEPTFRLDMPTTVTVPAGQNWVDFPVKIVDNRFLNTGPQQTTVTALVKGRVWEGDGPVVGQ